MPSPAERLSLLLEVHDDSLRNAAERCGLDHTTLMRVKNGETENPATLAKIAEGYGVPLAWIRGDRDLGTDFSFVVLSRPLQERAMFVLQPERRLLFALNFLAEYDPANYGLDHQAGIMGTSTLEMQAMIKEGRGELSDDQLTRLCAKTGIPMDFLRTGVIGREDGDELLDGLVKLVMTSLVEAAEADVTADQLHDATENLQ